MLHEITAGLRGVGRQHRYFALAMLTLGLGVGAATALFSVVNGVLLEPFDYREPHRIGILWHEFGQGAQNLPAVHPLDVKDYRERARSLSDMTLATGGEEILGGRTQPELVQVGRVAANFFPFFGVEPVLGRQFRADEDVSGGPRVAMLSHRLWQRRFGGNPAVIGSTVELSSGSYEVVGVLPPSFRLELPAEAFRLRDSEVWRLTQINESRLPPRNFTGYTAFARLADGPTFAQAQADLTTIADALRAEHPVHAASSLRVRIEPLQDDVVKGARQGLWLLMAAVGLLLAVTCVNVALLMLAHTQRREREMLIRLAVGAGRARIAQLIAIESLLVALGGAVLGVWLAYGGVALVRALAGGVLPRLHAVGVDATVLTFALVTACLSALLCGVAPVVRATRLDSADALREAAVGSSGPRARRLREALVMGQVVLSVMLVAGAGLVSRSFEALARAHPGFDPRQVATLRVSLPPDIRTREAEMAVHRELRAQLAALPGTTRVALTSQLPLTGRGPLQPFAYNAETARNWESESADDFSVSPDYFATLGATLVAGRDLTDADAAQGRRVIVIDDLLARRAFGSEVGAVGRQLQLEAESAPESFFEVVGVVRHLRYHDLRRAVLPQIYRPGVFGRFSVALSTTTAPEGLTTDVRRIVNALAPGAVVEDVRPLEVLVVEALGPTRLAVAVMMSAAALAIVLAAIGLYGVFSYAVGERRRELAVRVALGASPQGIRALVLGRSLGLVMISVALGTLGALASGRLASSALYGISPFDWPSHVAAVACLAITSLAACWIPAWRAGGADPLVTLRQL